MKTEILFGIHPVVEALNAGRRELAEIWIATEKRSKRFESVMALAASRRIPIKEIPLSKLNAITSSEAHQGIAAKAGLYPMADISQILKLPAGEIPFLLIADRIADTHNLGALIRTALCAGVSGLVLPKDRCASPTPAVSRISAGAMEHLKIVQVTNLVNAMKEFKDHGLWVAGTDASATQSLFDTDLTGPLVVVIGGEEKGIRPLVRAHCDFLISIPQKAGFNSLNASVAGAVVMYEVFRQRIKR